MSLLFKIADVYEVHCFNPAANAATLRIQMLRAPVGVYEFNLHKHHFNFATKQKLDEALLLQLIRNFYNEQKTAGIMLYPELADVVHDLYFRPKLLDIDIPAPIYKAPQPKKVTKISAAAKRLQRMDRAQKAENFIDPMDHKFKTATFNPIAIADAILSIASPSNGYDGSQSSQSQNGKESKTPVVDSQATEPQAGSQTPEMKAFSKPHRHDSRGKTPKMKAFPKSLYQESAAAAAVRSMSLIDASAVAPSGATPKRTLSEGKAAAMVVDASRDSVSPRATNAAAAAALRGMSLIGVSSAAVPSHVVKPRRVILTRSLSKAAAAAAPAPMTDVVSEPPVSRKRTRAADDAKHITSSASAAAAGLFSQSHAFKRKKSTNLPRYVSGGDPADPPIEKSAEPNANATSSGPTKMEF